MPKDNENILLPLDGPTAPSQPVAFLPDEMIRCDACLRANPPTRASCFYCGAQLPLTESSARLRKPELLSPDKSELAYNTILVAYDQTRGHTHDVADLLKLSSEAVEKVVATTQQLPIARTATLEESELLAERLRELGVQTKTVSDEQLGASEANVVRVRAVVFEEEAVSFASRGREPVNLKYADLRLMVQARLFTKKTSVKERSSRRSENEILETSESYSDESVIDVYCASQDQTFRIAANSFDFSCLGAKKALIVNQNMPMLVQLLQERAPQMTIDNTYNGVRQLLDLVWRAEKATQSDGWRRDSPGRLTVGATTTLSNEIQFTRYSRLMYTLLVRR